MEADLGSRLDWVAVNHWNTDNPHTLGGGWEICVQADQDCGGADGISNLRVVK